MRRAFHHANPVARFSLLARFCCVPRLDSESGRNSQGGSKAALRRNPSLGRYDGTMRPFGSVDRERLNGQPFDVAVQSRSLNQTCHGLEKDRRVGFGYPRKLTFEGVPNRCRALNTNLQPGSAPLEERKAYEIGMDA